MYVCAFTSMHVFIIVSHDEYHVCMSEYEYMHIVDCVSISSLPLYVCMYVCVCVCVFFSMIIPHLLAPLCAVTLPWFNSS